MPPQQITWFYIHQLQQRASYKFKFNTYELDGIPDKKCKHPPIISHDINSHTLAHAR